MAMAARQGKARQHLSWRGDVSMQPPWSANGGTTTKRQEPISHNKEASSRPSLSPSSVVSSPNSIMLLCYADEWVAWNGFALADVCVRVCVCSPDAITM